MPERFFTLQFVDFVNMLNDESIRRRPLPLLLMPAYLKSQRPPLNGGLFIIVNFTLETGAFPGNPLKIPLIGYCKYNFFVVG